MSLKLSMGEFIRRALFNAIAESEELFFALGRFYSGLSFQTVHGSGTDCTCHFGRSIRHRKQNNHSVIVETLKTSSCERHRTSPSVMKIYRLFAVPASRQPVKCRPQRRTDKFT